MRFQYTVSEFGFIATWLLQRAACISLVPSACDELSTSLFMLNSTYGMSMTPPFAEMKVLLITLFASLVSALHAAWKLLCA